MLRRTNRPALAVLIGAVMTIAPLSSAVGSSVSPGTDSGPPYEFKTEIMTNNVVPLKNQAMITRTKHGLRYKTGQQDNHLVVKRVKRGLRFVDTGTRSFKRLSPTCQRQNPRVGVAAVCRVPKRFTVSRPMLLEVWPRLGDDFLDTSTLSARFAATMLGDKGRDVARFGAGPDFFNGYTDRDRIWGGAGNDWIRSGLGNDLVQGGPGNDDIVAVDGHDTLYGGTGNDRIGGGDGDDRLWGGPDADFLLCGSGNDRASGDRGDDRLFHDCR